MFDLEALTAEIARHGRVARVVIAAHEGSSPREPGAAMLVSAEGQSGTIGGGALEWRAVIRARTLLERGGPLRLDREALGPGLGQCCGGAVTMVTEIYDAAALVALQEEALVARPVSRPALEAQAQGEAMPMAVKRLLSAARAQGRIPEAPLYTGGWLVEPVARPLREIWLWGAGHVGRALASVLAPLPDLKLVWIDTARDRFPETLPEGLEPVVAAHPATLADRAPPEAWHLILTYSHALDLELCHRLLDRGFGWAGLIGSATKQARFRARLVALGHSAAEISRITCPIGDIGLGKHPQAIAVGVAVQLLRLHNKSETEITDDREERTAFAAGRSDKGLAGRGGQ